MKKLFALVLALVLALGLVGCSKLPDPAAALELTFQQIKSGDAATLAEIETAIDADGTFSTYPELKPQLTDLVLTVIGQFDYKIVDKTVNEDAKTAVVTVEVTSPDELELNAKLEANMNLYLSELLSSGNIPSESEMYADMLSLMKDTYADTSIARTTKQVTVNMSYDADAKEWTVLNPEILYS